METKIESYKDFLTHMKSNHLAQSLESTPYRLMHFGIVYEEVTFADSFWRDKDVKDEQLGKLYERLPFPEMGAEMHSDPKLHIARELARRGRLTIQSALYFASGGNLIYQKMIYEIALNKGGGVGQETSSVAQDLLNS